MGRLLASVAAQTEEVLSPGLPRRHQHDATGLSKLGVLLWGLSMPWSVHLPAIPTSCIWAADQLHADCAGPPGEAS